MTLRILWCSPLPPTRSGVSDYAIELLRPLCHRARVRILTPPGTQPPEIPSDIDAELVPSESSPLSGEIPLIHLGNNPHHLWLIERCRRDAPVIVVHDLVLHHLVVEHANSCADSGLLRRLLAIDHPVAGPALAEAREYGIHGRLDPFFFPARRALLAGARALVTHSKWGEGVLRREFPDKPVFRLGLAVADPGPVNRSKNRADLGLSEDDFLLMHLGFLTKEKGLESVLPAVAAARDQGVPITFLLVGERGESDRIERAIQRCGLDDVVTFSGWVSWEKMIRLPAAADLGIVMRVPSAGETSSAVVRFLACGTPVSVVGQRQFLEWPAMAVPRITPGPSAQADIARLLLDSAGNAGLESRRVAARAVYEERHLPTTVAGQLEGFLSSL